MKTQLAHLTGTPTGLGDPDRSLPDEVLAPAQPLIEDYLDRLLAPCVEGVPYAQRQELRAEVRMHLEGLTDAYEELLGDREAAVEAALRQFGNARKLGEQWAGKEGAEAYRSAALVAFCTFTPVSALLAACAAQSFPMSDDLMPPFAFLALLPLLMGVMTGYVAPKRPVAGTFIALSALFFGMATLGRMLPEPFSQLFAVLPWILAMFWIPVGCLGAGVGAWMRRRAARRTARVIAG